MLMGDGFALAVGFAMQWGKLRDCSNKNFFINVFEAKVSVMDGARGVQSYRLFFPIDQQDEWVQEPLDKSLCFIKPSSQATGGTCVSAAELAKARDAARVA